ncbi:hypothetical protein Pla22_35380 [Rubripirellula amarantea]|uniref:Uncharacterized protein n=1 Tax=Rubripirellula amarantea TaxID=2527999 RepID=A0A5C5WKX8_9BACT|nr:hypothetical protein [Rubripirellula amarantea]TWT50795.1 hypothetical protein Pla22_35380 [Rubripirellula amarantea]
MNTENLILSELPSEELNPATVYVLQRFARRRRRILWIRAIAVAIVSLLLVMGTIALADYCFLITEPVRFALSVTGYALAGFAVWRTSLRHLGSDDTLQIARQLESADPSLREDLLSAVELSEPNSANGSARFRERLQHVVARRVVGVDVAKLLPLRIVKPWLTAATAILLLAIGLLFVPQLQMGRRFARAFLPGVAIQRASLTQIAIVKPSPASRYVAMGDAIAVVVEVSGPRGIGKSDDVVLEFASDDAQTSRWSVTGYSEIQMAQRLEAFQEDTQAEVFDDAGLLSSITSTPSQFSANIPVGSSPIRYRVVAGDAITLWHTLTPLPRPEVTAFKKEYVFPDYAKLSPRLEESEDGDLRAIVGTTATITVNFDQPVTDAVIKYGNRGTQYSLDSVDGSDQVFETKIRMTTSGHYQIDAIGKESELGNPFGPQYSIVPKVDTPPIVRWSEAIDRTQLVSPLDIVELAGSASDDLPLDQLIQEFEVNSSKAFHRELSIETPDRDVSLAWPCDLMKLHQGALLRIDQSTTEPLPEFKLESGDIVRTRLVAIDRKGNRAESDVIEFLVADEGFDSNRHDQLNRLNRTFTAVSQWADRAKLALEAAEKPAQENDAEAIRTAIGQLEVLIEESHPIIGNLGYETSRAQNLSAAGNLELTGRDVIDLREEMRAWIERATFLLQDSPQAWKDEQERLLREWGSEAKRLSQAASRLNTFATYQLAHELTLSALSDQLLLYHSLEPLFDPNEPVAVKRFPRHLTVAAGRLDAMVDLIEQHAETLPDSTRKHLQRWQDWNDRWADQFRGVAKEELSEKQIRDRMTQFENELKNQMRNGVLDGQITSKLTGSVREIRKDVQGLSEPIFQMRKFGVEGDQAIQQLENEKDSDQIAIRRRRAALSQNGFSSQFQTLMGRLDDEEALHRARPYVDLQFAADMNMVKQAMRAIGGDGFVPVGEESAADVYDKIGKAFRIIESSHEAGVLRREMIELAAAEFGLKDNARGRLDHEVRLDRFSAAMEFAAREMQSAGIDWQIVRRFDETRYNSRFAKARERISKRRWSDDELLSAEDSLRTIIASLDEGLETISPIVVEARDTIMQYVPTIPELARDAADKADEAQSKKDDAAEAGAEKVEDEDGESSPESADEDESQDTAESNTSDDPDAVDQSARVDEAMEAARETVEALHDFANIADMTDEEQRELSRDSDTAAALIQEAAREAKAQAANPNAMEDASEATKDDDQPKNPLDRALEELANTLRQTAEHFERAQQGDDVSESREKLRQAEAELGIDQSLENRFDRAEAMANATQKDPRELLKQLEKELSRNQPMQESLEEIAERTAESVQRDLEQMARDEKAISQQLERSDPEVMEQKRIAATKMSILSRATATIEQAILGTVDRAQQSGKFEASKGELERAKSKLRDAVAELSEMGGENARLTDMQATARAMATAIKEAEQSIEKVAETANQSQDKELEDDNAQKRQRNQFESLDRDVRRRRVEQLRQAQSEWSRTENDAKNRENRANQNSKNIERQMERLEAQLKRDDKNRSTIEAQTAELQKRLDDSQQERDAAKETKEFAADRKKEMDVERKKIEREPLAPLQKPNPSAELGDRLAQQALESLAEVRSKLGEISEGLDINEQLRARQDQAKGLSDQQQRISDDVADAAEALRRTARHQGRLEADPEAIDQMADKLEREPKSTTQDAAQRLRDTAESPDVSGEANQQVAKAQQQIIESASELSDLLEQSLLDQSERDANRDDASAQRQSASEEAEQQKAKQLAQTLDELDRAIAQSEKQQAQSELEDGESGDGESADGESGDKSSEEGSQGGEGQAQDGQSGQGGASGEGGKPMTAGQASPTLAQSMESQVQQAARSRAKSLNPDDPSQNPGDPQDGGLPNDMAGADPGTPSDVSGSGPPPGGGSVEITGIDREGRDWGSLRQRHTEDAVEGRAMTLPPEYRNEIQAYFQAIATKAGEKEGAGK